MKYRRLGKSESSRFGDRNGNLAVGRGMGEGFCPGGSGPDVRNGREVGMILSTRPSAMETIPRKHSSETPSAKIAGMGDRDEVRA